MFIVCAYYTVDTMYEQLVVRLKNSLEKFNIPNHIQPITNLGDWHLNTSYKPTFLLEMLNKFPGRDIIYIDADAEFMAYPKLFEHLGCKIGVHYFDRSYHGRRQTGFEVLSGTIFLKNCDQVKEMVHKWEKECTRRPYTWDQKSLEKVLSGNFLNLPEEYCTIFDTMKHVKEPVVVHYQASRTVRENKGNLRGVSSTLSKG